MKAQIKSIDSPDIYDLETFYPEDPSNFCLYIELSIGPKNGDGAEIFGIIWCSPRWFFETFKSGEIVFGKHRVFQSEYNLKLFEERISKLIDSFEFGTWSEFVSKMRLIGHWEFEDYQK